MSLIIAFVVGVLGGAVAMYVWQQNAVQEHRSRVFAAEERCRLIALQAEERISEVRASCERLLTERALTREHLTTTFKEVAGDTLRDSAKQYAETAAKDFKVIQTEAAGEIDKGRTAIEHLVKDLHGQLEKANEKIVTFEKERGTIFARIQQDLQRLHQSEESLRKETHHLRSALTTSSGVRGRWGEASLENLLQSVGMVRGTDYVVQETATSDEGDRLRPDFIVRLPGSTRQLVIDAKTSLFDILSTPDAEMTDDARRTLHKQFAERLRSRVHDLASKDYASAVEDAVPFVVMYVPSEAGIRAAFEADHTLFPSASEKRVMLASPVTIIPLILLLAAMREEVRLSENAARIQELVGELGQRLKRFFGHMEKVQKGLRMATDGWNEAVQKSWTGRQSVPRTLEKVRELGGAVSIPEEDLTIIVEPVALPDDVATALAIPHEPFPEEPAA
ncbi:MAG: DNA recombination protein RmuC [Thermoanaerobaculia bacterium]